jgi:hypothetical protein
MVTFQARVDVRAKGILGAMLSQRGPLYLIGCGDAFEVSHPFPLARFVFGQDYRYRAEDTTIEVVPRAAARLDGNQWVADRVGRSDLDRAEEHEPPDLGRAGPRRRPSDRVISSVLSRCAAEAAPPTA